MAKIAKEGELIREEVFKEERQSRAAQQLRNSMDAAGFMVFAKEKVSLTLNFSK